MIDDNLTVLIRRLRRYADDPMWDSHAEVPKILLGEAIEALERTRATPKAPSTPRVMGRIGT